MDGDGNRQMRGTGEDDGEEDEAGRMANRRGAALLLVDRCRCGGDVVAIASPRSGRGSRPSLSLSADTIGRSGERLAMVWTVEASDVAEERRGTGEDVGGILRPGSLSSWSVVFFALPHHMKEEDEDEAGRMAYRRCAALVLFLPVRSVPLIFPSMFAFVLSIYIIRYII